MITMCILNCGYIRQYHAAFKSDSVAEVSDDLLFIGIGEIHSANGILYEPRDLFRFFITKKRRCR